MSDVRGQKRNGFGGVDAVVFGLAFMLGLFGLLTIVSSQSGERGPTMLALLQLRNFLIGLAVLAVAARLDFSFYRRYAAVLAVLSLIPLVLLLFWGVRINGMCGWFRVGGVTLQPSELAKPLYLLALVRIFTGSGSALRRGGWWCWRRWPGWFRWGCSRIWERLPFTRRWRSWCFFSVEFR